MFYLLELREQIKKFYQEKEAIAVALFKFIASFVIFYTISSKLDYNELFSNILVIMLLSLIGAFVPSTVITFIAMTVACLEVFSFSPILGLVVVMALIILYCLFIRFTPKLGIAMLAVPIAYALNIPCFIPIVLGLLFTPVSIVAVGCGTVLYYLFEAIDKVHKIMGSNAGDNGQIYVYLIDQFNDNGIVVFSIIVFILITLIVYVIRTREITHAFEVAIVTGCIVHLLTFLIAELTNDIKIPMSIGALILGTIGAGILAFIVQNFRCALDYTTVERVQFEDDDYYYYVKAIPKIKGAEQKSDIKKISIQKPVLHKLNDDMDEFDEIKDEDFAKMSSDYDPTQDGFPAYDDVDKKSIEEEIDIIQKDIEENIAENIAEGMDSVGVFSEEHGYGAEENSLKKGDKEEETDDIDSGEFLEKDSEIEDIKEDNKIEDVSEE